jgi:hypothetical protein
MDRNSKYESIVETPMVGSTPKREVDRVNRTSREEDHGEKGYIASDFSTTDFVRGFSRFEDSPSQPVAKHPRPRHGGQSKTE